MNPPDPLKNLFSWLSKRKRKKTPPSSSQLIVIAEKVLAREGRAVAELVGRPLGYTQGILFRINEHDKGVADTAGNVVTLYKYHCDAHPHDVEGVVVHELAHAIQRGAAYGGEFTWMVEGLADFVRYKLGYGIILPGDPRQSYKVAGSFFNWLYEYPQPATTGGTPVSAHPTYYAFVKDLNAGIRPGNLDALLIEYNFWSMKKGFSSAARKGKVADGKTITPPPRKSPEVRWRPI